MLRAGLYIAQTEGKGRGVFTKSVIPAFKIIEVSPVIVMDEAARLLLDQTLLHDYIFEWQPEGKNWCCMAMGYVPIYNHAAPSNCEYEMDYGAGTITIMTVRPVLPGEELTINYNGDFDDETPVWFALK